MLSFVSISLFIYYFSFDGANPAQHRPTGIPDSIRAPCFDYSALVFFGTFFRVLYFLFPSSVLA